VGNYWVYSLEREDDRLFYIGVTCSPKDRLYDHRNNPLVGRAINRHKNSFVRKVIKSLGYLPMQILASGLTKAQAKRITIQMIAAFRQYGIKIANKTAGGDGVTNPSAEVRAKIANSRNGFRHTTEARAKNECRQPEACQYSRRSFDAQRSWETRRHSEDEHTGRSGAVSVARQSG
jgi:predicted GIY-YIG superfamily endonuclease